MATIRVLLYSPVVERRGKIDGDSIRRGGVGVSGTDSTMIIVGEQLAKHAEGAVFEVVYATEHANVGARVRGVHYTNLGLEGIGGDHVFDVLMIPGWAWQFVAVPTFRVRRAIVIWFHCNFMPDWNVQVLKEFLGGQERVTRGEIPAASVKIVANHLASGTADGISRVSLIRGGLRLAEEWTIPNPIMTEMMPELEEIMAARSRALESAPDKTTCVFHATWERGGDLALSALDRLVALPNKRFLRFDYYTLAHDIGEGDPRRWSVDYKVLGASDKGAVVDALKDADLFIYPQVSHVTDTVIKDTFACCVAEAMAMGVPVFTYPVGALPEVYKNHVAVWLKFPPFASVPATELSSHRDVRDPAFRSPANASYIAQQILEGWMARPAADKLAHLRAAATFVRAQYCEHRIGGLWVSAIQRLLG